MTAPDSLPLDERRVEAMRAEIRRRTNTITGAGLTQKRPTFVDINENTARAALAAADALGASSQDAAPAAAELVDLIRRLDWANIHTHYGYRSTCADCNLVALVTQSQSFAASAPPADAAPGLREALVECRDELRGALGYYVGVFSAERKVRVEAAIANAEAALGAPRSGTEDA